MASMHPTFTGSIYDQVATRAASDDPAPKELVAELINLIMNAVPTSERGAAAGGPFTSGQNQVRPHEPSTDHGRLRAHV